MVTDMYSLVESVIGSTLIIWVLVLIANRYFQYILVRMIRHSLLYSLFLKIGGGG